jgi:hypothetical protein
VSSSSSFREYFKGAKGRVTLGRFHHFHGQSFSCALLAHFSYKPHRFVSLPVKSLIPIHRGLCQKSDKGMGYINFSCAELLVLVLAESFYSLLLPIIPLKIWASRVQSHKKKGSESPQLYSTIRKKNRDTWPSEQEGSLCSCCDFFCPITGKLHQSTTATSLLSSTLYSELTPAKQLSYRVS